MYTTILRFELLYLLRRPATWVYFTLLFTLAFFFMSSDAVTLGGGIGKVLKNSPYVIGQAIVILTFVGSIITTALAGTAILRDVEMGAHELFYTRPLSKTAYLFGRFSGALLVMIFVYTAIPLGLFVGAHMPWLDATKLGPENIMAYVLPFIQFSVPTVFFISALFFTVGTLTRSMFAVYVQGICLFVLYAISGQIIQGLENTHLSSAMDPFGIRSFFFETRYWTVVEKNEMLVPFGQYVLINRAIWVSVSIVVLGLCTSLFRFRAQQSQRKKKVAQADTAEQTQHKRGAAIRGVADHGGSYAWRSLRSLTALYVQTVTKDKLFLALAVIGMINTLFAVYNADRTFGTSVYPVTYRMIETLSNFTLFILLISTFYGGELVWRERRFRANQIVDTLAMPAWTLFVSKGIALVTAQMLVIAALDVAAMLVQVSKGFYAIDVKLYLYDFIFSALPRVSFFTLLALSVHTIVNNKYVGHISVVVVWIASIVLQSLKIEHILFQFLSVPDGVYSEMNGFGPYLPRAYAMTIYWFFVTLFIAWISYHFMLRGTENSFAQRWKAGLVRSTRTSMMLGLFLFVGGCGTAGFVYYNTNVVNRYTNSTSQRHESALFEQRYRRLYNTAQPHIVSTDIHLDLVPEELRYSAHGEYVLRNDYEQAIDTLMVNLVDDITYSDFRCSHTIKEVVNDVECKVHLYVFDPPLAPHDSCVFCFRQEFASKGFRSSGIPTSITYNGTFLNNDIFPSIGYNPDVEVSDEDERKKEQLPPRSRMASIDDAHAHMRNYISSSSDWMRYHIVVSTAPDQIAVSPGYLQKDWMENGRHYFEYRMDAPILGFFSILSARYAVKEEMVDSVKVQIFYHPGHEYNLDRMMSSVRKSLHYYNANFSPYQFRQMRILEFPRYADFAQSFPNTVPYSEGIGFIARIVAADDIDYPFYVTAHEVGHQWWGHQVVGSAVQGATMLSETFAEYSALMVMKHEYGEQTMKKFLRFALNSYLRGRSSERIEEQPLYLNENQQYLHYNKGSLVMYALADYVGEDAVNSALSRFCQKYRFCMPPYPTTRDFMVELNKVVPDSLKYIVHDWFESITLYDNRVTKAEYTRRSDGKFDVALTIEAHKLTADSLGKERVSDVKMSDYVDIGVFDAKEDPMSKLGKVMYMKKVKLTEGQHIIHCVVDQQPAKAGVDPYNKLIDRDAEDNVMTVDKGS